ncbi:beta-propeller fold lactonase family protein [Larsenimonas salina]|uniref:beta-propeller fold lactonase family protein n=1 Tax=Larsenimonas salina TaxID=1295565 RepID=UPI002073F5DA|nr:beta-propeller fold lactonase family protein [Larsenimonas salina]MCM5704519.1 beta-propeller fold lactonase family protein [Larsenimonas salina]
MGRLVTHDNDPRNHCAMPSRPPFFTDRTPHESTRDARRTFLKTLGATSAALALAPNAWAQTSVTSGEKPTARAVYVGTYTAPHTAPGGTETSTAKGIYVFKMNPDNGQLSQIQVLDTDSPSFLAMAPSERFLYSVNELGTDDSGAPLGRVSAYRIDQTTGRLTLLNTRPAHGAWTCHCSVHPSGSHLFAANYGNGTISVYPLLENGELGKLSDQVTLTGNGAGPDGVRQEGAHAHMMVANPGGQHMYGIDLGGDRITVWQFDTKAGTLTPGPVPFANVPSGSGPRHMVFHPNDTQAYVINELSSTIDVLDVQPERGALIWKQSISTLPENTPFVRPAANPENPGEVPSGTNTTAEIRIHPSGRWLYATNRGMNTIALYTVDQTTGTLRHNGWSDTKGEIPRGMNLDPSGNVLYVGNQNSNSIAVFHIDSGTGKLSLSGVQESPVPVDVAFGPVLG